MLLFLVSLLIIEGYVFVRKPQLICVMAPRSRFWTTYTMIDMLFANMDISREHTAMETILVINSELSPSISHNKEERSICPRMFSGAKILVQRFRIC
jgi:hypothetical protein